MKRVHWLGLLSLLLFGCAQPPHYRIVELPPLPGYHFSDAYDIDNKGVVTGYSETSEAARVTQWRDGVPRDLGAAPPPNERELREEARQFGVRRRSEFVGAMPRSAEGGEYFATLQRGKKIYDLNTRIVPPNPEWQLWTARAINRKGMIVGAGLYQGRNRGFLLIPTRQRAGR